MERVRILDRLGLSGSLSCCMIGFVLMSWSSLEVGRGDSVDM